MVTINDMQRIAAEMKTLEANRIQEKLHSVDLAWQIQAKRMYEAIGGSSAATQIREAMKRIEIPAHVREAITASERMGQIGSFAFHESAGIRRAVADLNTTNQVIGNQVRELVKGFDMSSQMRGMFEAFDNAKKIHEALSGIAASRQVQEAVAAHAAAFQSIARSNAFEGINNVARALSQQNWPAIYEKLREVSITDSGALKVDQRTVTLEEVQQVVDTVVDPSGSGSLQDVALQIEKAEEKKDPLFQLIFWQFITTLIAGLIVAFLQVSLERYLESNDANDKRSLKKAIGKEVVSVVGRENLRDYRLVVATTLNVRTKSSSKAAIVGTLQFGQVVQLLEKDDDWSRIRWTDGGDAEEAMLEGWVFSRYLQKFR